MVPPVGAVISRPSMYNVVPAGLAEEAGAVGVVGEGCGPSGNQDRPWVLGNLPTGYQHPHRAPHVNSAAPQ